MSSVALVHSRSLGSVKSKAEVHSGDRYFRGGLRVVAWTTVLLLILMAVMIFNMSWPAFKQFGPAFFWTSNWDSWAGEYGALALIHGTLWSSFLALLLAVPVALGVALFLTEIAPRWLARPVGFLVEMLAAIPSIVYGLWGLYVLVPWLRQGVQPMLSEKFGGVGLFSGPPIGIGMMAAAVILAVMITPTIAALSREVFNAIPLSQREAALGLGATQWEAIKLAVLRPGFAGLIGATMLGLGRALGETMAVTMVIGNRVGVSWSLFAPGQTMASLLANQYAEADSDLHLAALTGVGFCLFLVSLVINALARWIVYKVNRSMRGE